MQPRISASWATGRSVRSVNGAIQDTVSRWGRRTVQTHRFDFLCPRPEACHCEHSVPDRQVPGARKVSSGWAGWDQEGDPHGSVLHSTVRTKQRGMAAGFRTASCWVSTYFKSWLCTEGGHVHPFMVTPRAWTHVFLLPSSPAYVLSHFVSRTRAGVGSANLNNVRFLF